MKMYEGKTALITGAAHGFGFELVKQAAMRKMNIVAVDIMGEDLKKCEPVARELGAADILLVQADVSLYEETEKAVKATMDKFGRIDLLVNNAGVAVPGPVTDLPLEDWEWIVHTNIMSHIYFMRQVIPIMKDQGTHCNILNVASAAGLATYRGMPAYYSTKHAAVALAECAQYEVQEKGYDIQFHVFCPGFVQTSLDHSEEYRPERFKAHLDDPYYQSEDYKHEQAVAKYVIETGMPIEGFGERIFSAIENDEFYILTHAMYNPLIMLQTKNRIEGVNPDVAFLKGLMTKAGSANA